MTIETTKLNFNVSYGLRVTLWVKLSKIETIKNISFMVQLGDTVTVMCSDFAHQYDFDSLSLSEIPLTLSNQNHSIFVLLYPRET